MELPQVIRNINANASDTIHRNLKKKKKKKMLFIGYSTTRNGIYCVYIIQRLPGSHVQTLQAIYVDKSSWAGLDRRYLIKEKSQKQFTYLTKNPGRGDIAKFWKRRNNQTNWSCHIPVAFDAFLLVGSQRMQERSSSSEKKRL